MNERRISSLIGALLFGFAFGASAQTDEEELALAYGDKSFVTIATGAQVPVARAPAVATVITAEDIRALGAIDLDEVLQTVPGFHVSRSPLGYSPIFTIRGVRGTLTNPQVLMLVNGIPMTTAYTGDRGSVWGGLPIENVARIEVIRGPGSALYGADAFSGVINITTKTAAEIAGTEVGARAGAFRTVDAWILHGGKLGALDVAGYLRIGSTQGAKPTIGADAQSELDALVGTAVSHAPGAPNLGREAIDGSLDLSHDKWRFRAGFKKRDQVGSGAGAAQALDPTGNNLSERVTADITYQDRQFAEDWDISLQASYFHYKEESDLVLFPPGANFIVSTFPAGMIGNPDKWERHGRFTASAFYTGFANHRLRLGAGTEKTDLYKTRESKNFNLVTLAPGLTLPVSLGSVVDVSDTNPFIRPHKRLARYVYAQDEWSFARDWTLTAGVRHDRYSDFGRTTNPRLAIVWEAAYNLTAKVLYGSAFRAPALTELYSINNPVNIGNPNLQPEKIRTLEAALSWQPSAKLNLGVNVFRYRMSEIIRLVDTTWQNTGKQTGSGMELEAAWDATRDFRLVGNYGYQRSIDKATNQDAGMAPHRRVFLRGDWRLAQGWLLNTQVNWVGDRKREPGDTRPEVKDYTTVDLTLGTRKGKGQWDVAVIARNIFDSDAREPSPSPGSIPNDLALPGRAFYIQTTYRH